MPFVVDVKRPMPLAATGTAMTRYPPPGEAPWIRVSRRAVGTLEEPGAVENAIGGPLRANLNQFEWHDLVTAVRQLGDGGRVGPLPDGTVIEVEPIWWADLRERAGLDRDGFTLDAQTIAAYNAAQTGALS